MVKRFLSIFRILSYVVLLQFIDVKVFSQSSVNWSHKAPFDQKVFIENKGQVTNDEEQMAGKPILYYSRLGSVYLYFTASSIVFRYDKTVVEKNKDGGRNPSPASNEEREENLKLEPQWIQMQWMGAGSSSSLEVQNEVNDYYTYPNPNDATGNSGIRANAWKKLIYKNLYPGIDFTYYFPENKGGFKYDITVHPGADLSMIKMKYSGADIKIVGGNVQISSGNVSFVDHAPVSMDGNGGKISSSFRINRNEISFQTGDYDKTKLLIIDPWSTSTLFSGDDKAYDVEYDNSGNVYVAGGGTNTTPCILKKYNSAGVLQWTFTPSWVKAAVGYCMYGAITVDKRTGTTYFANSWATSAGGQMAKVNTLGIQLASLNKNYCSNDRALEIWRMEFDYCNNILVLGLGTPLPLCPQQAATLDTTLNASSLNFVNVLNVTGPGSDFHDISLLALDNAGSAYMATNKSVVNLSIADNTMLKVPLPSLAPTAYQVPNGHAFVEITSIKYYPLDPWAERKGNGYNGMLASPTILLTYDGSVLKKWISSTGAFVNSVTVSSQIQAWGGMDWNCKKDIYVGNGKKVDIYDSTLTFIGTAATFLDTIYDVKLNENLGKLYVCGRGFVADAIIPTNTITLTVSNTAHNPTCQCIDTAMAVASTCGAATYLWSNGATTQTVTGLCPGNYSVTATAIGNGTCPTGVASVAATATVYIPGSLGAISSTVNSQNPTCAAAGSATVTIAGGTAPYTYSWNPAGQSTQTATGLSAGSYTVIVTDSQGCSATASVTLTGFSGPTVNVTSTQVICNSSNGSATANVSGGTPSYSYSWSNGQTASTITGLSVGTYTISVTDAAGCTASNTITISSSGNVVASAGPSNTICAGQNATLTASGGINYLWSNGATTTSINVVPSSTSTYSVIVSAGICADTAAVTITVSPLPVANVSGSTICAGQTATLTASGGGNYSWSNGATTASINVAPTTTSTYSVIVAVGTCTATASGMVTVNPLPSASVTGNNVLCLGDIATLTASGGIGYNWSNGNTNSIITVSPSITTTYTVVASNGSCSSAASITVAVSPPPIAIANGATICAGQMAVLTASGGGNYLWNNGATTSSITVAAAGSYSVIVSIGTCTDTASALLVVNPNPTASAFSNVTITVGQSTTLSASGGGVYHWSNGATTTSISVSPPVTTVYCVTVTNSFGCPDSACVTVYVEPIDCSPVETEASFALPNAFSPNEDGNNERWHLLYLPILPECIGEYYIAVYNRWGEKVFEGTSIAFSWDGTYKSKPENTAVFVYYMKAVMKDGTVIEKKGNVSLVR